jgi:hypothetical protein
VEESYRGNIVSLYATVYKEALMLYVFFIFVKMLANFYLRILNIYL